MGKRTPTWRLYEQQIFENLRMKATDAEVFANAQLSGRHSRVDRQIDVLLRRRFPGLDCPPMISPFGCHEGRQSRGPKARTRQR